MTRSPALPDIPEQIERFKAELRARGPNDTVERLIIFGDSFVLKKDDYYSLKSDVADHFKVERVDVVMVGSAKLGFSISPLQRYEPFWDKSDIDIAIVSDELFDRMWKGTFEHSLKSPRWAERRKFSEYLARGWIRPDLLPTGFGPRQDWWEFFRSLTATRKYGPYQIRAGIYREWHFMRAYHVSAVEKCAAELEVQSEDQRNQQTPAPTVDGD